MEKKKSSSSSVLSLHYVPALTYPYMITGKTIPLTIQIFVGKVISLLYNMLCSSYFSSKEQVSFNFVATVTIHSDFGAQKNKVNFFNSQPPAFYFSCTFCLPHPLVLKAPTEFSLPHPSEGRPKCYIHQELSHILSLGMHLSRKLLSTYT